MAVSVVTLLVDPDEAERLTLASTEGKIQLALRNPLDKATPVTRGIKPAVLLGLVASTPRAATHVASGAKPPAIAPDPTVEIIRGDKRAHEVVRQEQQ
jgi:pilus assembly protein CpaB